MSGSRKKNAAPGASSARVSPSGNSTNSHRSRRSSSSANSAVWQWKDDIEEGVYHDFDKKACQRLEAAYVGGKVPLVKVQHAGRRPECVVDTRQMTMYETTSRSPSSQVWQVVRLIDGDGSGSSQPCWQWQYDQYGDRDTWGLYSPDCAAALEAAWLSRRPNPVRLNTINGQLPYEVDVVARTQTNVHTSYERLVRRLTLDPRTPFLLPQPQQQLVGTAMVMHTASAVQPVPSLVSKGQPSVMSSLTGRTVVTNFHAGASLLPSNFSLTKRNLFTEVTTLRDSVGVIPGSIDQFIEAVPPQDSVEVCPICLDELHVPSSYPDTAGSFSTTASNKSIALASSAQLVPTATYSGSSFAAASAKGSASNVVVCLVSCKHQLHQMCLNALMEQSASAKQGAASSIKCPTCGRLYGMVTGTCPRGKMTSQLLVNCHLRGFEDCGVILITYDIMSGIQGPEHPHPGRPFTAAGFPRMAYLPDNAKGHLVLRMLQVAFERRLTFTVGSSVTTGQADVVTWNEIHHKTSLEGTYGYPDAGYLERVVGELEAFGIMASDFGA